MESSRDDFVIAIRSAFLKKGTQQRFSLLGLILFSIIFLILGGLNFKGIDYVKTGIKEIAYRASFVVSIPEKIIKNSFIKVSDHFSHYDQYIIMQNELKKLEVLDLSKKIMEYENTELKRLIDDYFIKDNQVFAKVLSDKNSPFLRSIIINKGSKNNIKMGMVVEDDSYLIGRVIEVNYLTSRVLLISDINSKIPVTIEPLNIEAIMIGFGRQKGKLQYIENEKLIKKGDEELIVVTSGSGGIFKSGIPIGKIDQANGLDNSEITINFFKDLSQLKYAKISSYKKEEMQLDVNKKTTFEINDEVITNLKNQKIDIDMLQQQNLISEEIRSKLEEKNAKLKIKLINTQKQLEDQKKKSREIQIEEEDIKFLKLNLLYGHKCRRTLLRAKLFKVGSPEYRACVLNKEIADDNN
jgi:rod shape-determining protein MreC